MDDEDGTRPDVAGGPAEAAEPEGALAARREAAFLSSPDALHILDMTGCLVDCNDTFLRHLGYRREEVIGRHAMDWDAHMQAGLRPREISAALAGGPVYRTIHRRQDGSLVDVDLCTVVQVVDGRQLLFCTARDISAQRLAEAELTDSRRRLSEVLSAAPFGVQTFQLTDEGGLRLVEANEAADRMLCRNHHVLQGADAEEVFPGLRGTDAAAACRRVASAGGRWEGEVLSADAEGIAGAYEVHAYQSAPRTVSVMFRDITERRRAELDSLVRHQQLLALYRATELALRAGDTGEVHDQILDLVCQTTGFAMAWIERYDRSAAEMVVVATRGVDDDALGSGVRQALPQVLSGIVAASGSPIVVHRVQERRDEASDGLRARGVQTYLCVPMAGDDGVLGALCAADRGSPPTDDRLVSWCSGVANTLATMVQRQQAEDALRESRRMLRLVIDTIPVRVFWKNRDLIYEGCNQAAARDAGLSSPEAIIGRTDYETAWFEQADLYRADDQEVLRTGQAKLAYEEPQHTSTGGLHWLRSSKVPLVNEAGEVTGVLGTYEDITDSKHAEEAVRRERAFLAQVVDAFPAMVSVKDAEGRFLLANRALAAAYGTTAEAMVGRTDGDYIDDAAEAARIDADDREVTATRQSKTIDEVPKVTADGQVHHLRTSKVPLLDEDGTCRCLLAATVDITDRIAAEQLRQQRQQAQKLESLGAMASGIAHEFNNLLTTIIGNLDLLADALPADSAAGDCLQDADTALRRAAELSRQMLAYSGREHMRFAPVGLDRVVGEAVDLLPAGVAASAEVRVQPLAALPPVYGDAAQLRQVVLSLVVNAAEAIGEGPGSIVVSAAECGLEAAGVAAQGDSRSELTAGPYLLLEVADTGCGMSAEVRERIFDPFYTTKFAGRGLGLAAAAGIVRGHGGVIWAESEPGVGTTLKLLLPAAGADAASP